MKICVGVPHSADGNSVNDPVKFSKGYPGSENAAALECNIQGIFWLVVTRSCGSSSRILKLEIR